MAMENQQDRVKATQIDPTEKYIEFNLKYELR